MVFFTTDANVFPSCVQECGVTEAWPDNVYMFLKKKKNRPSSDPMYYSKENTIEQLENILCGYQEDLKLMSHKVSEQHEALEDMNRQLEVESTEVESSRHALSDISNQLQKTVEQQDAARKQTFKMQDKLEAAYADCLL